MTTDVKSRPLVVACIPAFNEERSIGDVVDRTKKHVDRVVVCDDGSLDKTGENAIKHGAIVVRHDTNKGYGASLQTLFRRARQMDADIMVTLDGDSQHDPDEIPLFLKRMGEGDVDIVIGSRFIDGGSSEAPNWRNVGIHLITGLVSNGLEVTDSQSGFRAYGKKALASLVLSEDGMGISTEILLKAGVNGLKVAEVPISVSYDENSSTHNPIIHGLNVVLSTVKHLSMRRPLVFYGIPGFLILCVASVFWAMTLKAYAATKTISTNVTLIALSGTVVGLMLISIGIILWVLIGVVQDKDQGIR